MSVVFVIAICVVVVTILVIATMLIWLKKKSNELTQKIDGIHPFHNDTRQNNDAEHNDDENAEHNFVSIQNDLELSFRDQFISNLQERKFTDYYAKLYDEAVSVDSLFYRFNVKIDDTITGFVFDYKNIHSYVEKHNELIVGKILDREKHFFDTCLKYPLDWQQRRSIVSEEDNCLVVSSAGSGKTSSIIGKVKYLVEVKNVDPDKILLISYTNKAARELTDRLPSGLRGYTFHKLAIDIIGNATGAKPSICDNTDALFVKIYRELLGTLDFKEGVVKYFLNYQLQGQAWEQQKNERREQLSEQKTVAIKSTFPDMDGQRFNVRSEQELKISSALFALGVKFRYEEPYEYKLDDGMHSQYKPDFSIYFEKDGTVQRIYLEHFGIDEHSLVPEWFAKERGIPYEEANKRYNDGIVWKKAVHEKFDTKLITTTSADFYHFDIREKLKALLTAAGVPLKERSVSELYDSVLPKDSKQEKAFIRLVVTFVTLLKSSCRSVADIERRAVASEDERGEFIVKKIFRPVYERYVEELKRIEKIDFTDVVLRATNICRSSHPVAYDYIIVDEFQDISVDRYNFLMALREGNPPAKLYCVGDDWQSIFRFSGSDMALFNHFADYFGYTEVNKIETTYRFGEPLVSLSSNFIQRNKIQVQKDIHPFNTQITTELNFIQYDRKAYCDTIFDIVRSIPVDKSIFFLGRYSFDDYYLSFRYQSVKKGDKFFYVVEGREIEFLTVHKSKGLEADYIIVLQCNKDTYGFPSLVSDDSVLNYVLTKSDEFPYGEERRLFYVAITRAKLKTFVLYDKRFPSVFVDEFLHPETMSENSYAKHPNANKRWTPKADAFLLKLQSEGKSIKYIATKMGRSQTSIIMRLGKLNCKQ